MARKSPLTPAGRRRLRGPRRTLTPRGLPRVPTFKEPPPYITDRNEILNSWESTVAWALVDLGWSFTPLALLGTARTLGGAQIDFLLEDRGVALEVDGPFHESVEGQMKDFRRTLERELRGYRVVRVKFEDLDHIHQFLLENVGTL